MRLLLVTQCGPTEYEIEKQGKKRVGEKKKDNVGFDSVVLEKSLKITTCTYSIQKSSKWLKKKKKYLKKERPSELDQ